MHLLQDGLYGQGHRYGADDQADRWATIVDGPQDARIKPNRDVKDNKMNQYM